MDPVERTLEFYLNDLQVYILFKQRIDYHGDLVHRTQPVTICGIFQTYENCYQELQELKKELLRQKYLGATHFSIVQGTLNQSMCLQHPLDSQNLIHYDKDSSFI